MDRFNTYIKYWLFILALIIVCVPTNLFAQDSDNTSFGISFSNDLTSDEILDATPELQILGISVIELQSPVSDQVIRGISESGLQILIRSDLEFLTNSELNNSDLFRTEIAPFLLEYSSKPGVVGISLPSYSDSIQSVSLEVIQNQIPDTSGISYYQVNTLESGSIQSIIDIKAGKQLTSSNQILISSPFKKPDITLIKEAIDFGTNLILMDWYWFKEAQQSESYFSDALIVASESSEILFPNYPNPDVNKSVDWPIIILVLLWITVGIHLRSNPTYRPLIFRYFTFHRFFVDDIMRYRERSAASGITLFIQHAYFTGLVVYILSAFFLSEKGLEALYSHLPLIAVFGQNYFTLFVLSIILTLSVNFLCLFWLFLPSKSMKHFSQVINLYSWVFHLDFIIVSLMLILLITSGSSVLMLTLATLHILTWLTAFVAAAIDSAKYLAKSRIKYLLVTNGLFLIAFFGIIIAFVLSGYPFDVLKLALSL